jgi:glycosyltransferase involved in cell wall biosynthesis
MLIGLDAYSLTEPKAGVGHYTFELARALAAASPADVFELAYPSSCPPVELAGDDGSQPPPNLRAARVRVGPVSRRKWSLGLTRYARARKPDLFHGTNYTLPLRCDCPTVLTIHDLSALLHPQTHAPRTASGQQRRLPVLARAASMIITPTEAVRLEVCETLRVEADKVVAVPEAPRSVFRPLAREEARGLARRLGVEGDFVLAVGTIEPRKNLLALVRAFETLTGAQDSTSSVETRAARANLQLVIAGKVGWLSEEFFAHVASSPARARIHFTGYVGDEVLRALYSACRAFVYPSLYEGFGLPPLEAAACGAPVVVSRIAALDETLGGGASLNFDPADADELAARLSQLLDDPLLRAALSEAGLRRAAAYTWARTASLTLNVYRQAVSRG